MPCHHQWVKIINSEPIPINCGNCVYCKKRRISSWVFRLLQEERVSRSSFFITLTYDNQHVPITTSKQMTLQKSDFQKFMKRLRKHQPKIKLKYYACGEYGTQTFRPHYHLILFNLLDVNYISKAWTLGHVDIGTVTGASIAYTAKYIDKEKRIPLYKGDLRQREFSLQSQKLGQSYLTPQMIKYHRQNLTHLYCTLPDGIKVAMPDYYRKQLFTDDEKLLQRETISLVVEENLKKSYERFELLYKNTDFRYYDYTQAIKDGEYNKYYSSLNSRKL